MNFSFAGCGFLGIYHVGVAACLKKYAPNLLVNKISGASAGALAAVCLLCDGPLGVITSSVLKTAAEARKLFLGPFSPTFNIEKLLREGLLGMLPEDAHKRVNGKIFISVTRVCDGKNVLLSHFETKEELIQALLCSAFIPGFSGWTAPRIKGIRYVDGGFTDNLPQLDTNTVTISPFCGEADICPKDFTAGLVTISLANTSIELSRENLYRFSLILFPPPPEVLNRMCQQGFNDALEFLQRNHLINCTRCLSIQSTFNLEAKKMKEDTDTILHLDDVDDEQHCADCVFHRQEAILDTLPEAVGSILQDAIDKANKGLMNWVFKHKSMKFVSILTLPYVIPVEVVYATFVRFVGSSLPTLKDIRIIAQQLIQFLRAFIRTWLTKPQPLPHHRHPRHHLDDTFSCQLAITEFTGEGEIQRVNGERQKIDFAVDMANNGEPQVYRETTLLEAEALSQLALRCAKSISHFGSVAPSRSVSVNPSRVASRAVSRTVSRFPSLEDVSITGPEWDEFSPHVTDDTFEHILNVTNNQDALMAYYYMDENNEMRVTEIFDMSAAAEGNPRSDDENSRQHSNVGLTEGALQSHLESFRDKVDIEEKLELTVFSPSSLRSSNDSVVSEPEADQFCGQ